MNPSDEFVTRARACMLCRIHVCFKTFAEEGRVCGAAVASEFYEAHSALRERAAKSRKRGREAQGTPFRSTVHQARTNQQSEMPLFTTISGRQRGKLE